MALLRSLGLVTVTLLVPGVPGIKDKTLEDVSCSLWIGGEHLTSYKWTEPGQVTSLHLVNDGDTEECQLRMLLVGGGGVYQSCRNG